MEPGKSILILARTRTLQMGLQALLQSVSREHRVLVVADAAQAFELIEGQPPALALLEDDRSDGQVWDTVREIKRISSLTRCIVLLENFSQKKTGFPADAVVMQGTSPERLVAIIEHLLQGQEK